MLTNMAIGIIVFGDREWLSWRTREQQKRYEAWIDDIKSSQTKVAILEFGAGKAIPTGLVTGPVS